MFIGLDMYGCKYFVWKFISDIRSHMRERKSRAQIVTILETMKADQRWQGLATSKEPAQTVFNNCISNFWCRNAELTQGKLSKFLHFARYIVRRISRIFEFLPSYDRNKKQLSLRPSCFCYSGSIIRMERMVSISLLYWMCSQTTHSILGYIRWSNEQYTFFNMYGKELLIVQNSNNSVPAIVSR